MTIIIIIIIIKIIIIIGIADVFRIYIALWELRLMICKLKFHKIGTNNKFKGKQATKKVLLLFLKPAMHKVRYNRQV